MASVVAQLVESNGDLALVLILFVFARNFFYETRTLLSNSKRTQRGSVRSVLVTSNGYRPNWTTRIPITNLPKILQLPKRKEKKYTVKN